MRGPCCDPTQTRMPPKQKRNLETKGPWREADWETGLVNPPRCPPQWRRSMEPPRRRIRSDSGERTALPFKPGALRRGRAKLEAFHLRDVWWRILDFFEASRGRRIALYCTGVLLMGGVAARIWVYPWWTERSAIRVAQQWLEAGQYRNAAEAAERASRVAPNRPEPWRIASELAR